MIHSQSLGNSSLVTLDTREKVEEILKNNLLLMKKKPRYVFPWDSEFDIDNPIIRRQPIWIEFPKRHPINDLWKWKMVVALGEMLYYGELKGNSDFQNDKSMILWDTRKTFSRFVKIGMLNTDINIYQPVTMDTSLILCNTCSGYGYLSGTCRIMEKPPLHWIFPQKTGLNWDWKSRQTRARFWIRNRAQFYQRTPTYPV